MAKQPLAITLGDPAGIGPEITVKALDDPKVRAMGPIVVVGSAFALEEAKAICKTQLPIKRIEQPEEAEEGVVNVLHTGTVTSPIAWGPRAVAATASAPAWSSARRRA